MSIMDETISNLALNSLLGQGVNAPNPFTGSAGGSTDFQDLITLMMLGMSLGGGMGESGGLGSSGMSLPGMGSMGMGSSGGFGMDISSMIMPVMISLLEQLQAQSFQLQPDFPKGMPIDGHLTQSFHQKHNGLDFGAPVGTPVQATMAGEVVFAGWSEEGYGNLVIVENGPYRIYFAHLDEIPVSVGQIVQRGTIIGLSGNTGKSTGPHLHYEIRVDGRPIDPSVFSFPGGGFEKPAIPYEEPVIPYEK
jgi:murein DD-endopeptidase MepM/ murein hydrolase activator NlpD